jgi:hypothetical protein
MKKRSARRAALIAEAIYFNRVTNADCGFMTPSQLCIAARDMFAACDGG